MDPPHSSEGSLRGRGLTLPGLLGTFPTGFCAEDCPSGDWGRERKETEEACRLWAVEGWSGGFVKFENSPVSRNWCQKIRCGVCFTGEMVQRVSVML